jgi:atypical dual specificity phosphatase
VIINFSWLLSKKLAGFGILAMPTVNDLHELAKHGVGALVSLTEVPLDTLTVEQAGLRYTHIPIPDMQPPSLKDIGNFVEFVEDARAAGQATAVHCLAGRGRTGTMLACYLVHEGSSWGNALEQLRAVRPGSVETLAQEQAVRNFARSLSVMETRGEDVN